jgi:hypothetical protein
LHKIKSFIKMIQKRIKKQAFLIAVFIVFIFTIHLKINSQTIDYSKFIFDNYIYNEDIASVKIEISGNDKNENLKTRGADNLAFFPPVIDLYSENQIKLTFDDLSGEIKYMKYTLVHCTHDWQLTKTLYPNEYLSRFLEDDVIDYVYSRNTSQSYVSFTVKIPNENIKIEKSGNYLLCVYEDNGGKIIPLITRRIMVAENLVTIIPNILQSTNISDRFSHQEINFEIDFNNQRFNNPSTTIRVLLMQNERYDNALLITKPYINQGNKLLYNERGAISMEGGNEYRTFNIKSLRTAMEHVEKIDYHSDGVHVYLYTDEDKHYKAYENNIDINGYYFNETIDFTTVDEADYAYVHFRLKYDKPFKGDIYVFGELTNWQLKKEAKLSYMEYARTWQTQLYLKSGYYNYIYLFVPEGSNVASADLIEGSHWETENRYTFYVYYQADKSSYDRIIGYNSKYSFPKNK